MPFGLQRTPTQTHDKHAPCPVPANNDTRTWHKDLKPRHIRCKTARNDPNSGKAHIDVRPTHKRRVGGRVWPDLKEAPLSKCRHQSTLRSGDPCSTSWMPVRCYGEQSINNIFCSRIRDHFHLIQHVTNTILTTTPHFSSLLHRCLTLESLRLRYPPVRGTTMPTNTFFTIYTIEAL
jgi:hypothetical protein